MGLHWIVLHSHNIYLSCPFLRHGTCDILQCLFLTSKWSCCPTEKAHPIMYQHIMYQTQCSMTLWMNFTIGRNTPSGWSTPRCAGGVCSPGHLSSSKPLSMLCAPGHSGSGLGGEQLQRLCVKGHSKSSIVLKVTWCGSISPNVSMELNTFANILSSQVYMSNNILAVQFNDGLGKCIYCDRKPFIL